MTTASESQAMDLDQAKMEEFAGSFIGAINGASVVALASVGRHTGLFDGDFFYSYYVVRK